MDEMSFISNKPIYVLTRISFVRNLPQIYTMNDFMVSKGKKQSKPAVRKLVFIALAVCAVAVVALNVINYFVLYY